MGERLIQKLVHEGEYVIEVEVKLIETNEGWSPYLTLEDANKLDEARLTLQAGDLKRAQTIGRLFRLTPVTP
ncbi:MAG: hypothetical protein WDZ49_02875 [Litorilinea sp.]